ncbi:hypothetical protein K466DRAFT_588565 [Polyporus arcularius HHB13444]|uniref:Uncharacterized protein n=1 Tax=Polyporus arcularius HHB13444 TaxID=1314778 RepID=A0A5C3PG07_9APHY|nr:hypothetical protein K466DRAFT_588565 [Polyporus arcularius HHB13444]
MSQQKQASSTTAVASPASTRPGSSTITAGTTVPTKAQGAAELMATMKRSLDSYGETLEALGKQVLETLDVGSDSKVTEDVGVLRRHMRDMNTKQDQQLLEIQALMKEVLEKDVVNHLTELIESEVMKDIDALVDQEVARLLPDYIPEDLQEELRKDQRELEEVQKALYNSESRRANSTLRSHRLHETVHDLYNVHGEKSSDFPRTLGEMFSISHEKAISMMEEFGAGEPSASRERNINRLMQTFGIQYQLVSTGAGAQPVPCRTSNGRSA